MLELGRDTPNIFGAKFRARCLCRVWELQPAEHLYRYGLDHQREGMNQLGCPKRV